MHKISARAKTAKEICCRVVVAKETCCLEVVELKVINTCAEMNLERISKMGIIYNFNFWMRSRVKEQIVKIILISQKAIS